MSPLRFTIAITIVALLSSGCCLTRSCGLTTGYGAGLGLGHAAVSPTSCGVIHFTGGGNVGGCLGLGCIGKLLGIRHYGCGAGGCGEVYYHDWISDPPCPDACDQAGNGGSCNGGCGACDLGPSYGVAGEVVVDSGYATAGPGYGLARAHCGGGCLGGYSCFQHTGRLLYHTFTGVGGILRGIRYGLLPVCGSCNAFSFSHSCVDCSTGPYVEDDPVSHYSTYSHGDVHADTVVANNSRVPHEVVTQQIRTAHGRPPHKVLSNRLR